MLHLLCFIQLASLFAKERMAIAFFFILACISIQLSAAQISLLPGPTSLPKVSSQSRPSAGDPFYPADVKALAPHSTPCRLSAENELPADLCDPATRLLPSPFKWVGIVRIAEVHNLLFAAANAEIVILRPGERVPGTGLAIHQGLADRLFVRGPSTLSPAIPNVIRLGDRFRVVDDQIEVEQ